MSQLMKETPIRGNYSLRSLERMSMLCVRECRGGWDLSFQDRQTAAWEAMAELLLRSEEVPTTTELVKCGIAAVFVYVLEEHRHHGWDHVAGESRPSFERYWDVSRNPPAFEDQVVDGVALTQIWQVMPGRHRNTLLVYAAAGSAPAAAEAAGKKYATYTSHLSQARRAFLTWWHEGETPSRLWGRDNHRSGNWTPIMLHRVRQRRRKLAASEPPKPQRTHCGNGHDLRDNLGADGRCKTCGRDRQRRSRARQGANTSAAQLVRTASDTGSCLTDVASAQSHLARNGNGDPSLVEVS